MLPQRLLVPLFQRPYVWNEENQWRLLWDDVRGHCEVHLNQPGAEGNHFLGAIVLQHSKSPGLLPQRTTIDGQQRLTTLQLLLDAVHAVLTDAGEEKAAAWLTDLTTNADRCISSPEDQFKVWPTNRDRSAYNEVMAAPIPVDYEALEHRKSLIVQAHAYFAGVAQAWLNAGGAEVLGARAAQLVATLTTGIQLVVIDLETNKDSQEFFETLNARGTPLTAADLIKNLVFQRLAADGDDTERAYRENWALFETEFWEKQLSIGRYRVLEVRCSSINGSSPGQARKSAPEPPSPVVSTTLSMRHLGQQSDYCEFSTARPLSTNVGSRRLRAGMATWIRPPWRSTEHRRPALSCSSRYFSGFTNPGSISRSPRRTRLSARWGAGSCVARSCDCRAATSGVLLPTL